MTLAQVQMEVKQLQKIFNTLRIIAPKPLDDIKKPSKGIQTAAQRPAQNTTKLAII